MGAAVQCHLPEAQLKTEGLKLHHASLEEHGTDLADLRNILQRQQRELRAAQVRSEAMVGVRQLAEGQSQELLRLRTEILTAVTTETQKQREDMAAMTCSRRKNMDLRQYKHK